jgi:hypothetical protein
MLRPLPRVTHHPRPATAAPADSAELPALRSLPEPSAMRVLDFDIENRPLSYWYDGKCTAEVTAIAWQFIGEPGDPTCYLLGLDPDSSGHMLEAFVEAYNAADMVTGHYIRKHDLPIVNGALIEHGLPTLGPKLTSDTRLDLIRFGELAKSQAALGAMLGLAAPKEGMTQTDWRQANRLTPGGLEQTHRRVVGDVRQHIELRAALLGRELLGPPRMWRAG